MTKSVVLRHVAKRYKMYEKTSDKIKDIVLPQGYGDDFYALQDISFEAQKGDVIGVIGVNGSGKSTLSNIISGVIPPTSGTIETNGQVALIAIAAGLKNELTGRENIELKCLMLGFSKKEIKKLEPEIIDFADIGAFIDQPVKKYSSGMKSRLGFAISVNIDPDILVIDEALSVGDQTFADKCLAKMNEFKEKGKTIFFISHSIGQMKKFCEKALWIQYGRVKDFGMMTDVMPKYEQFLKDYKKMSKEERKELQRKAREQEPDDHNKGDHGTKGGEESQEDVVSKETSKGATSKAASENIERTTQPENLTRVGRNTKKKPRRPKRIMGAVILCCIAAIILLFVAAVPKETFADVKNFFTDKVLSQADGTAKETNDGKSGAQNNQAPEEAPYNIALVKKSLVNLRDKPDLSSKIVGSATLGDTYKILGEKQDLNDQGVTWLHIRQPSGGKAWISASVVNAINSDQIATKDLPKLASLLKARVLPSDANGLHKLFKTPFDDTRKAYTDKIINEQKEDGADLVMINDAEFKVKDDQLLQLKLQNIDNDASRLKAELGNPILFNQREAKYVYFINGFNIQVDVNLAKDEVKDITISRLDK
ncbi:teichoic acid transport system ATP-binding protein [Scopulibacillus darangshiensis]|uniref:Teichoic acid transport system ATP-binding protein n=1 Tax=Scopulibacillus darangshiensis TaxID=442528 RepID=A0A4R2NJZ7_9BACL|nr:teichoic acids export ABC transporter ATP-binding subunit TagH [Scopulibacillus darangshiensis]TCP21863.1 teichoic acid transport system ATP-binding protein [Scopulibacillus darangshiensis]